MDIHEHENSRVWEERKREKNTHMRSYQNQKYIIALFYYCFARKREIWTLHTGRSEQKSFLARDDKCVDIFFCWQVKSAFFLKT